MTVAVTAVTAETAETGVEAAAPGAKTGTAAGSVIALAIALCVGFFPAVYTHVPVYDDEGFFLTTMREFLSHGHLYSYTRSGYGPFYYSVMAFIFRITGQTPTPFSGRLLALVLTGVAAALFAAVVWRVTRSVAFSLLAEVVTFLVLIAVAGAEPMHPGPLIVVLLAVMAYALASYALDPQRRWLIIVGAVVGALVMTKINVGLFAAAAVIIVFVVGNERFPKPWRFLIAMGGVLLPFVLMSQLLYQVGMAEFAVVVSLGMLLAYVPMHVDTVRLPRRAFVPMIIAAAATMAVSCIWPLATGTGLGSLLNGVFIRPLRQANALAQVPFVDLEWLALLITVAVVYLALTHNPKRPMPPFAIPGLANAALGLAGLYVLGLGLLGGLTNFLAWLPAIVLLPALAWISDVPPKLRLVMRFFIPVAILQILHAYPVPGSQRAWGIVFMCVPCVIAIALAADRLEVWKRARSGPRALAIIAVSLLLMLGTAQSPIMLWHDYTLLTPLDLPGTRGLRVTKPMALEFQKLTAVVRRRCDTFYSAPGFDSLYIYTGLPIPTGLLSNWPGVLTASEQRILASQLAAVAASGKRVCIVRDLTRQVQWQASSYGDGPLGAALAPYNRRIAVVGHYSVSLRGAPPAAG